MCCTFLDACPLLLQEDETQARAEEEPAEEPPYHDASQPVRWRPEQDGKDHRGRTQEGEGGSHQPEAWCEYSLHTECVHVHQ